MSSIIIIQILFYEKWFNLILQMIQLSQIPNIWITIILYKISENILHDQFHDHVLYKNVNNHKLNSIKE